MLSLIALPLALGAISQLDRPAPLVVHEWGTFTSLQDEDGKAIGGINTDDEPVPPFVHRLASSLLIPQGELAPVFFQGAPRCHPDVTLRLETPVVYFHPRPGAATKVEARVAFNGGWITEYFPVGQVDAPGLDEGAFRFGSIGPRTIGRLAWKDLQLGSDIPMPQTSSHVWTTPRRVHAARVSALGANGRAEAEQFLFYRGVGRVDAPVRVIRGSGTGQVDIRGQADSGEGTVTEGWLVSVRRDGSVAFRSVPGFKLEASPDKVLATVRADFGTDDFAAGGRGKLRATMLRGLTSAGLFEDEAMALLDTWELSYFRSSGLRLFFLVPRAWTDRVLPLSVSPSAQVARVMVARIELVTAEQREGLRRIAKGPVSTSRWFYDRAEQILQRKETSLLDLGIPLPDDYRAYVELGRFRNALLLDEAAKRPTPALKTFIESYSLEGYTVPRSNPN